MSPSVQRIDRFGRFELDLAAYQLRRDGQPVRLERRPMDLLILLVERRGQLVTRAEIVDLLWGKDVFVEVDTAVHTAVRKIRQALRDSPDNPAFIETVPAKGYRFAASVDVVAEAGPSAADRTPVEPLPVVGPDRRFRARVPPVVFLVALVSAIAVASAAFAGWLWLRPGVLPSEVMLAVLPFANLTGDPGRDYLADGLSEEIIASLGQINPERVLVVGRTSMLSYKGTTKPLVQIGKEVGADYLVEGSIRAEDARLRITAKLIRAGDQSQVWAESFDHELSSILALERELSGAIADQVARRLTPERLGTLERRQTPDAEAYDLDLRGISFSDRRTPASNQAAIDYYRRATARDPRYALAWAGMADIFNAMPINADVSPLLIAPQARAAASRAFELEPDLAEVQFVRGQFSYFFDWDWTAAEASHRRSIAINPGFSMAHRMLGHLYSQMRRHDEARDEMRRAVELDPFNPMVHALSSQVAFQARDNQAAVEHAKRAIALDPEFWIGYMQLAQVQEQLGNPALALEAVMNSARYSGGNSKTHALRGYILARIGRTAEAREVITTLDEISRERFVPPYGLALVYAGLGDRDAALEWLQKAYDARDVHLIFLTVDPKWDPYRADPRFAALMAQCGFRVEAHSPGTR